MSKEHEMPEKKSSVGVYVWRLLIIVTALTAVLYAVVVAFPHNRMYKTTASVVLREPDKSITLGFVGDIMLARGIPISIEKYGSGDSQFIFSKLEGLKKYDVLFGNLEGVISDKGKNVGSIYSFRMDPIFAPLLRRVGFDVLSVANNHSGDWSVTAFADSINKVRSAGIKTAGGGLNIIEATSPSIIEVKGKQIGFIGFSDVGPGWLRANDTTAGILIVGNNDAEIISEAKDGVDVLIVSYHFGEEYKTESNNRQQMIARGAIDAGADIVIGHHPHVVQEIEVYKDGLIAYSLGNFIFDQSFSEETMRGMLLEIVINEDGTFSYHGKVVQMNEWYQPEIL
ncbi:hypothetical protein COB55_01595 [Candidatus Wolfebacteria bacterium]|nr:MAG: hypothetical protein COB55_01595 [Candidatus Wolfebacteria bacterium]